MEEIFKESVRKGFIACKSDIEEIKKENVSLKSKIISLEFQNKKLQDKINELSIQINATKMALDYIKAFTENQNQANIQTQTEPAKQTQTPRTNSQQTISRNKPLDSYDALLEFKAKTNKREILKQKLLSMIGENKMNLSELKFMFVEHFRYCSKATFYNYLKELEIEKTVKIERENGKNKIYLSNISHQL